MAVKSNPRVFFWLGTPSCIMDRQIIACVHAAKAVDLLREQLAHQERQHQVGQRRVTAIETWRILEGSPSDLYTLVSLGDGVYELVPLIPTQQFTVISLSNGTYKLVDHLMNQIMVVPIPDNVAETK